MDVWKLIKTILKAIGVLGYLFMGIYIMAAGNIHSNGGAWWQDVLILLFWPLLFITELFA